MPALKIYDLFISHAWRYGEDYTRLINLLNGASYFTYRNYSAPSERPLHNLDSSDVRTKAQIKDSINRKIAPVNCVLVVSGMYYYYRDWMQYELDVAAAKQKPIIAIKPFGNSSVPKSILDVSICNVNWSTDSIVSAIRQYSL